MFVREMKIALATLLALGLVAGTADANHRKRLHRAPIYDPYYAGPGFVRHIPGLRVLFGDYALTEDEYNELYGPSRQQFDDSYYEPQPAQTAKPRKKPVVAKTPAPAPAPAAQKNETASLSAAKKPQEKSASAAAPVPSQTQAQTRVASGGVICDKAGEIISGYGFSAVTAQSCKGKIYTFNATRDGKPFTIKLDSESGELTEVKKLP